MRPDEQTNQPIDDDLSSTGIGNNSNSYSGLMDAGQAPTVTGDLVGEQDQTSEAKGLGANLALGMPLQFYGDVLAREKQLRYGDDAYKQEIINQENLRNSLQQIADKMPTDDQHWYTSGAARFVGSLIDPLTFAAGRFAEIGLKAAVPSIARTLETDAGETLGTRILKSAVKGTVSGFAGANISSGVQAAVEYGSPDHITMNDYLSNLINWSAMGAIHGVASPILNDIWKNVSGKYEPKTLTDDAVSMQNDSPIKEEAAKAQADTGIKQFNAGKKIDVEAQVKAEQNRSINEINNKENAYSLLSDEAKQQIPSPIEQLQNNVDQAKININESEQNINNILDNINETYDGLDSENIKNEALKTPLPRLIESITKNNSIEGLSQETQNKLNTLNNTIKQSTYNFGPAKTISDALKLGRTYLVHPDDREIIQSLHDPINEADMIDDMDKDNYSDDNKDILNQRSNAIRNNVDDVKSMPLYSQHLPNLNDAIDDFADKNLDLQNAQNNLEYKTSELNDLSGSINNMAESVINNTDNINDAPAMPSIDDITKDDQPYSNTTTTLEQMDRKLQQHLDNGDITKEDFDEINQIDEAEKNDAGQQKFFNMIKTCLLGNGL